MLKVIAAVAVGTFCLSAQVDAASSSGRSASSPSSSTGRSSSAPQAVHARPRMTSTATRSTTPASSSWIAPHAPGYAAGNGRQTATTAGDGDEPSQTIQQARLESESTDGDGRSTGWTRTVDGLMETMLPLAVFCMILGVFGFMLGPGACLFTVPMMLFVGAATLIPAATNADVDWVRFWRGLAIVAGFLATGAIGYVLGRWILLEAIQIDFGTRQEFTIIRKLEQLAQRAATRLLENRQQASQPDLSSPSTGQATARRDPR